jgi:hypothetical protein
MVFVLVLFVGRPSTTGPAAGPSAPPTELATVVAAVDIPLGTVVTQEMFTSKTLAVTVRDKNVFGDISQVVGKTTRTAIAASGQVHSTDFQNRAVPLAVPAGKRAMAIQVNELTGVGNLLDVGDSVDLIVSLRGDAFPVVQVLNDGSVTVVSGTSGTHTAADIVVLNYEIVHAHRARLGLRTPKALVLDESHYVKNPAAKRTRAVRRLAENLPPDALKLALTGTPVMNHPDERRARRDPPLAGRRRTDGGDHGCHPQDARGQVRDPAA